MRERVGNVEAIVAILLIREDEQVLLAAPQPIQIIAELRRYFTRTNLQHNGDIAHDPRGEGRAFFAEAHLRSSSGTDSGGWALGQDVIAAPPPEEGGDYKKGEGEGTQHQGGIEEAHWLQSHHHGGGGALRGTSWLDVWATPP